MKSDRNQPPHADAALELRLRDEAAAQRRAAPAGLRESILSGLAAAPGPARARRSLRWGFLAAAGLAAVSWFASSLGPFGPDRDIMSEPAKAESPRANGTPQFLEGFDLARVFVVSPTRLGASVEAPLLTEMQNLAHDTRGIVLAFYSGIPAPIQDLIGLGPLR